MKFRVFRNFLFRTLRGRLILGVAAVHAVMMTLFITDLTSRQRSSLLDHQTEAAETLAQSLSTSAAVWIAANDISGLQELIESQHYYPELAFAIITDERGRILAHTDNNKRGLYLLDLPKHINKTIISKSFKIIDVIVPAYLGNRHIGWVRVGIGSKASGEKLNKIIIQGILYTILTILIGSIIAWLMGHRFTKRLYTLQNTISKVRKGNQTARSYLNGNDEAASIANEFNFLLDSLGAQNSMLSTIINSSSHIIIFSLDKKYCYTAFNEKHRLEMKKVWNVDIEIGMSILECMHIEELKQAAKLSMDRVLNGESFNEVQHQPDPPLYYEFNWNPIFQNKEIIGITAFIHDITVQKLHEIQIKKLNRIYSVLSNINQTIIRMHEPREMMTEACRIAVEEGDFEMAWIGMINNSTNKVDVVASYGTHGDYLDKINIDLNDSVRSYGPTGTAAKTGKHKIVNNISLDDSMTPWQADALKYGYRSSASFPLIVHEKIIGVFNLYSNEIDFFHEEDIKLLDEMAIDISFAIDVIENELQRKQAQMELQRSSELLRAIIEAAPTAIFDLDLDGHVKSVWNPAAENLLGWKADEVIGHFLPTIPHDKQEEFDNFRESIRKGLTLNGVEVSRLKHDGTPVDYCIYASPMYNTNREVMGNVAVLMDITERKRKDEALQKSEAMMRSILENVGIGIALINPKMEILELNRQMRNWFPCINLEQTSICYRAFNNPPRDSICDYCPTSKTLQDGLVHEAITQTPQEDIIRNYRVLSSPVLNVSGQVIAAIEIVEDITERKRNEAINASRIHLMQFAAINTLDELLEETINEAEKLSNSKIGFYHFVEDNQTTLTLQNWSRRTKAEFCKAEGKGLHYSIENAGVWVDCVYSRKPVVHNNYSTLPHRKGMPEGHAEVVRELIVPVIRGDKVKAILGIGNKPTNYDEKDIEVISLLADLAWEITERKMTDESLKASEEKYRTLIQKIQTAVVVHGADTQIITCNVKAQELLGLTEDQLLGKTAIDPAWHFYREDNTIMPFEEYPVNRVMASQQELKNCIVGVRRPNSNNDIWALVNAIPVFDKNNIINQVIISFNNITELKRVEKELRESEERFRRLTENARDVIYRMSLPDGKYEYVSPAAYLLFGHYPDEYYSNPSLFKEAIHPNWHKYFEEQWANLLKGEMPPTYEYQVIHKSGEVRWLNQRNILIKDNNGKPVAIEGIVTDITSRKHIEDALTVSEERYRLAQTISHTGNWEYNLQTGHFWGSEEAKRIYGFDPEADTFTTEEVESCIPERERVHQALIDLIEKNKPYNLEFEIRPKDSKKTKIIDSIARMQLDEQGSPLRVVGVIQDITDRKEAENALIKSEKGLKEAQRLGRIGNWYWDAITDTITWSEEYYRIFGIDPAQPPPGYEEHLKVYTNESATLLDTAVKKNMETGDPYIIDLEIANPTGPCKWITARSETIKGPNGKIIGLRGTAQDITERKQSEEEIKKLNQGLEQRVKERTSQLELANKELEAFAYSVSHDLRAPLRSIDGFSQVLVEEYENKIDPQGRNYLGRIRSAAQRMAQLIDDILSLSKVSRGELNIKVINLSDIAQEIINNLKESQPERKVVFVIHKKIIIKGDGRLLRIVLENLIGNAWKFTSKHQVAHVEFGSYQQKELTIYFVKDDGAGFDMNYAKKLFGAFQRLHSDGEFSGTGIGLATVQRIINRHGGTVWAEAEPEKGATFYFTIPQ